MRNHEVKHSSSEYCIVCSPPQVKSPFTPMYSHFTLFYLPLHPFPSGNHHIVFCVYKVFYFYFLLNPFTFFTEPPKPPPPDSCQSVLCICESISILFATIFCSLECFCFLTYRMDVIRNHCKNLF